MGCAVIKKRAWGFLLFSSLLLFFTAVVLISCVVGNLSPAVTSSPSAPSFQDVAPATMLRNANTPAMSLGEISAYISAHGTLPPGYRNVPIVADDNRQNSYISHAGVACGLSGSIAQRVADCNQNLTMSTLGTEGEADWELVTRTALNGSEVWRDTRTGLVWSDKLMKGTDNTFDWNSASGAEGTSSHCAEVIDKTTDSEFDDQKGNLSLRSTPARVIWRLPSRNDWLQAIIDGIEYISKSPSGLDNNDHWSSTPSNSSESWVITPSYNGIQTSLSFTSVRNSLQHVRCVGIPLDL